MTPAAPCSVAMRNICASGFGRCVRLPRRYQMAVRLGEIMEELEQQDHAAGDELNPVPSWIRAHFVLEQEFEQINARQQELEAAMSDADNQRMQVRSVLRQPGRFAGPRVRTLFKSLKPNGCGLLAWAQRDCCEEDRPCMRMLIMVQHRGPQHPTLTTGDGTGGAG